LWRRDYHAEGLEATGGHRDGSVPISPSKLSMRKGFSLPAGAQSHCRAGCFQWPRHRLEPQREGPIYSLAVSGSVVYSGGHFTSIGGQNRNGFAALDASTGNATDSHRQLSQISSICQLDSPLGQRNRKNRKLLRTCYAPAAGGIQGVWTSGSVASPFSAATAGARARRLARHRYEPASKRAGAMGGPADGKPKWSRIALTGPGCVR